MATAYYYQEEKNPNGAALPGVPLRDLTDDEVASYPKYIQRSIEASPMYRKTNPNPEPRAKAPAKKPAKKKASAKPVAAPEPMPADNPPAPSVEDAAPEPEEG